MKNPLLTLLTVPLLGLISSLAHAQGTAFTYQGWLNDGTNPASGKYDLRFAIYDAASAGTQQGNSLTTAATGVTNGLFTVTLDFGNQFPGANRWLEIAVRTNGAAGYFTLSPRQALTPAPYAITAGSVVSGGLAAGTYGNAVTLNNANNSFTGTFNGNGGNVTNVNAAMLNGLTSASFWKTGGNTSANPTNGAYLGTSDNLPLEFKVNGTRALRLEPTTNSPNIVGGSPANVVSNGFYGGFIGGGGSSGAPNRVGGAYASVLGGFDNRASGVSATAMGDGTTAAGFSSVAMGYKTIASGNNSTAIGNTTTASGDTATAIGFGTSATGFSSTALGNGSIANGDYSVALGWNAQATGRGAIAAGSGTAQGIGSTALGQTTFADGLNSTAMGLGAKALGSYSVAMGNETIDSNVNATAMGWLSVATGEEATAMGYGSMASGGSSLAVGYYTIARGFGSLASGYGTQASGDMSTALGSANNAQGEYSVALGNGTRASGQSATALGGGSTASGNFSTAMGQGGTASGSQSVAAGLNDIASGDNSVALGENCVATNLAAVAIGYHNTAGAPGSTALGVFSQALHNNTFVWSDGSPATAFTSSAANQFLIYASGGVGINTPNPLGDALCVNGDARIDAQPAAWNEGLAINCPTNMTANGGFGGIHFHSTGPGQGFSADSIKWSEMYNYAPEIGNAVGGGLAFIRNNSSTALYLSSSGNVGVGTTAPDALLTVNGTADKPGGGSWNTYSDARLKDVKNNFTPGLAALEKIQPVYYHYKADNALELPAQPEFIGVVAQQLQQAVPEAVQTNSSGYLTVNNDPVLWTTVNAVKELNHKLETENAELKFRLERLEKLLTQTGK